MLNEDNTDEVQASLILPGANTAELLDRTADLPPRTAAEQMASARLDLARRLRRRF